MKITQLFENNISDIIKNEIDEKKIVIDRTMSNQPVEIYMCESSLQVIDFYTLREILKISDGNDQLESLSNTVIDLYLEKCSNLTTFSNVKDGRLPEIRYLTIKECENVKRVEVSKIEQLSINGAVNTDVDFVGDQSCLNYVLFLNGKFGNIRYENDDSVTVEFEIKKSTIDNLTIDDIYSIVTIDTSKIHQYKINASELSLLTDSSLVLNDMLDNFDDIGKHVNVEDLNFKSGIIPDLSKWQYLMAIKDLRELQLAAIAVPPPNMDSKTSNILFNTFIDSVNNMLRLSHPIRKRIMILNQLISELESTSQ